MDPNQQSSRPRTQTSLILSVFLLFTAIMLTMVLIFYSLHQVPEGHVGVYWKGGALLKPITEPGFHIKTPFIIQYKFVQVTFQTDEVTNITCDTKGGVKINFEKIQVVNRLHKEYVYETLQNYGVSYKKTWIHDKIHHHINNFCTSHSFQQVYIDDFVKIPGEMKEALQVDCTRYVPGIEIISVHLTKPAIPDSIRRKFEQLEEEHMKMLIAIEKEKVAKKEAETKAHMLKSSIRYMEAIVEIGKRSSDLVNLLVQYIFG